VTGDRQFESDSLHRRVCKPSVPSREIRPGVIESKSNFIEHPELIAQRIARYANLVGRDNVIAGSDLTRRIRAIATGS
jgi:methionine synthase II (cobalamin-independent)